MKISTYLLAMTSIVSFSVFAAENTQPDDDQLLLGSCQALTTTPEHDNAKPCIYFIKGFLASAQAIDSSIVNQKKKILYKPYRTKGRMPPNSFIYYCVPVSEPDARVIKTLAKQLPAQINTVKLLRDNILKTLKTTYPCRKPDQN